MIFRVVAYSQHVNRYGVRVTFRAANGRTERKWWVADEDLPALGSRWDLDVRIFS